MPTPPKRRRERTFTGCLTCRRRKVKCDIPLPCGNCHRLGLQCVSPFSKNLKHTASNVQTSQLAIPHTPIRRDDVSYTNLAHNSSQSVLGINHLTQAPWEPHPDAPQAMYSFTLSQQPEAINEVPSGSFLNCAYRASMEFDESWGGSPDRICTMLMPYDLNYQAPNWNSDDVGSLPSPDAYALHLPDQPELASSSTQIWQSPNLPVTSNPETTAIHTPSISAIWKTNKKSDRVEALSNSLGSPPRHGVVATPATRHSLTPPRVAVEEHLLQHYKVHMSKELSVKDNQWNVFTFLFNLAGNHLQSPLRSSLLAWAGLHVSAAEQGVSEVGLMHYAIASSRVETLLREFSQYHTVSARDPITAVESNPSRMLLSTTFILLQCDIFIGDRPAFNARMDLLKGLLNREWDLFWASLTGMDYRLLLWLAYLDVRASAWGYKHDDRDEVRWSTNLLETISRKEMPQSLYLRSRSYLHEAFGDEYPSSELRGDMLQDPTNMKFAEAMSILSRISLFGERYGKTVEDMSKVEKTREAVELQTIRVDLKRIWEECDLALKGFLNCGLIEVNRSSYHWLILMEIYYCAVIMFNRILNPEVRTDPESQECARNILRIVLKLRDANMLHNPHSMMSSFPIFVAGIEIQDEIYKDWTLSILSEFQGWGTNISKVEDLLRRIMKRQEATKCRVNVCQFISEFGSVIVV